jgi:flagellin
MTRISTGIHGSDQRLLQNFQRNTERTQASLERLSTGKRINHPKDDPPAFVAAEGLRQDLNDLKQKLGDIAAERSQSHIQQSGLSEIQDALTDLRGRIVAGADGTLTADQRTTLESEIDEASQAIDRVAKLTGNGAVANLDSSTASLSTNPDAAQLVDDQSQSVSNQRVNLAANEHANLDTFQQLTEDQIAITSEALSNVEDTDFAAEASNLFQSQALSQSAMAAIAYNSRQNVSQLTQLLDSIA